MSNSEDHNDSSEGEDQKKAYENILSHPSYFSSTMKVSLKWNCVLTFFACKKIPCLLIDDSIIAYVTKEHG